MAAIAYFRKACWSMAALGHGVFRLVILLIKKKIMYDSLWVCFQFDLKLISILILFYFILNLLFISFEIDFNFNFFWFYVNLV